MNLVLYTHPAFLGSHSQAHFARMLVEAYRARGHSVTLRQPQARVHRRVPAGPLSKWAGYVDQYLLFPLEMRAAMARDPADTLYVFCDQALGPWIPHAARRPHVVHCHDLLALRSALGDIPENPTSATGRLYQRYIRAGFRRARHFISISEKSRADLHRYGGVEPVSSEVVYNGLNHPFRPLPSDVARGRLKQAGLLSDERSFLLHIGGGQWYKNTAGVVRLYASYVRETMRRGMQPLPLWMLSPAPTPAVQAAMNELPAQSQVRFFSGLATETVEALYAQAAALLFPSHAEGFGWPIAEAMACGCPVLTTGEAPMTEVGGDAATYLPRLMPGDDVYAWAHDGALCLVELLGRSRVQRDHAAEAGRARAARFNADAAIEHYLAVYQRVLALELEPSLSKVTA